MSCQVVSEPVRYTLKPCKHPYKRCKESVYHRLGSYSGNPLPVVFHTFQPFNK